jgi:hypothetical protein
MQSYAAGEAGVPLLEETIGRRSRPATSATARRTKRMIDR